MDASLKEEDGWKGGRRPGRDDERPREARRVFLSHPPSVFSYLRPSSGFDCEGIVHACTGFVPSSKGFRYTEGRKQEKEKRIKRNRESNDRQKVKETFPRLARCWWMPACAAAAHLLYLSSLPSEFSRYMFVCACALLPPHGGFEVSCNVLWKKKRPYRMKKSSQR
mmetsp:Transcript_37676/g.74084  ORF Transcript_37676/g.74084 Transcript_37676/m.74084 type:complete len:166 (-) Transcript_37676:453-950(-)